MAHSEEWNTVEEIIREEKRIREWHLNRGLCPNCATPYSSDGTDAPDCFVTVCWCPQCGWEEEFVSDNDIPFWEDES